MFFLLINLFETSFTFYLHPNHLIHYWNSYVGHYITRAIGIQGNTRRKTSKIKLLFKTSLEFLSYFKGFIGLGLNLRGIRVSPDSHLQTQLAYTAFLVVFTLIVNIGHMKNWFLIWIPDTALITVMITK